MNYPVTTPFGQVAGYPLNNGFHNGIDYGFPMGTPVVVNGVEIGLSNNTGTSTGPHLHVGKYVNGVVQNPGVGNGFSFNSAVVFDTGSDATNGNFVRITGDEALWNYLHLEKVLVSKGQVLSGQQEEPVITEADVRFLFEKALGIEPTQTDINWGVGKPWNVYMDAIYKRPEALVQHSDVDAIWSQLMPVPIQPADYAYAQGRNFRQYIYAVLARPECISTKK